MWVAGKGGRAIRDTLKFLQSIHNLQKRSPTSDFIPDATKRGTQTTCTDSKINVHSGGDADKNSPHNRLIFTGCSTTRVGFVSCTKGENDSA
jgi:hypothetical protein